MTQISGLVDGIPWTQDDYQTFDDLPSADKKKVLDWISCHVHYSGSGETTNSYSLKHDLEKDLGIYTTNNQFKHAMLKRGFEPFEYNELNWEYPVISDKSPRLVAKEKERRIEIEKRYERIADFQRRPQKSLNIIETPNIILDNKPRFILKNDNAKIIGGIPQTTKNIIHRSFINRIAEIMIEDTGIIYYDINKNAFCSILEYYSHDRLLQLLGCIGEAIIVHRCNSDPRINQKWLSIATMNSFQENSDSYIAIGTGFKSTQKTHPQLYNPFDTQNDIIWIDEKENKVIRYEPYGSVGTYAALQVKASTNGEKYILRDLIRQRYGVPLVYYPINDDFERIVSKAPTVHPGIDFINVKETDREAFDELMFYWNLLSRLYQGTIKPIDIVNQARGLPALQKGLFSSAIDMTNASYYLY